MNSAEQSDRFISVEGSINLRDFGGYPTIDGQTVNKGLLFRCGALSDIPETAWDDFAALDIGVICDLRSDLEAEEQPSPTAAPFDCRVHIPIWPGSSAQFMESIRGTRPSPDRFIEFMKDVTRDIARDHVEQYRLLAKELVDTERGFLLHCSAGKDRTGFGAAIILHLLGVSDELILEDYMISNQAAELGERMKARMFERAAEDSQNIQPSDQMVQILSGVRREYLEGAFDEIDNHYGGVHGYFEAIGISAAEEAHLKERLLS